MTVHFKTIALFSFALLSVAACKQDEKKETPPPPPPAPVQTVQLNQVPTEGADTYELKEGVVYWSGSNSLRKDGHEGTIAVKSAEFLVSQNQLIKGKATLDMLSIAVSDVKDPGERRDLESHLKDSDFFEATKYPEAQFEFDEVLPSTMPNFNWVLHGTLKMKGKTAPVNIPVKVSFEKDLLVAETPSFPINRTQWGVNFHSGILGTAKDKMIDDMVPLTIKLSAKKK